MLKIIAKNSDGIGELYNFFNSDQKLIVLSDVQLKKLRKILSKPITKVMVKISSTSGIGQTVMVKYRICGSKTTKVCMMTDFSNW